MNEMQNETKSPPSRKKGCGCLVVGLALFGGVFLLGLLGLAGVAVLGALADGSRHDGDFGKDEFPDMEEVWSSGSGTTRVVRIPLTGMIDFKHGPSPLTPDNGTYTTLRSIRRATLDDQVSAIFLDVDSGGGSVTASDILYSALLDFKGARDGRFVVACFGDTAASGAYYVALAADAIYAHPTTVTGSIGVIMRGYNAHGLAEKLGVEAVSIASGENKDMLNPLVEPDPAAVAILQEVVDGLFERFVGLVAENRDLPEDRVREVADGRVFLAETALEKGLIDGIGYEADALDATAELLGLESADDLEVIRYAEHFSFWDLMFEERSILGKGGLPGLLGSEDAPRMLYRWMPR